MKKFCGAVLFALAFLASGCCNCGSDGECGPTGSSSQGHANTKLSVIPGATIQIDLTVKDGKLYYFIGGEGRPLADFTAIYYAGFSSGAVRSTALIGTSSVTIGGIPLRDRFNLYVVDKTGNKYWLNLGHVDLAGATVVGDVAEF